LEKNDIEHPHDQLIWLNSHIKVDGSTLYHRGCIDSQFHTISALYHNNNILDINIVNIVYDINLSIMEYNSSVSAIPREWKRQLAGGRGRGHNNDLHHNKFHQVTLMPSKMFAKSVYKDLILNVAQCTNLQDKWEQNTTNNMLMTNKCFTHIYKITIDNTLRSF